MFRALYLTSFFGRLLLYTLLFWPPWTAWLLFSDSTVLLLYGLLQVSRCLYALLFWTVRWSWLLYLQRFGHCIFHPSSDVCLIWLAILESAVILTTFRLCTLRSSSDVCLIIYLNILNSMIILAVILLYITAFVRHLFFMPCIMNSMIIFLYSRRFSRCTFQPLSFPAFFRCMYSHMGWYSGRKMCHGLKLIEAFSTLQRQCTVLRRRHIYE